VKKQRSGVFPEEPVIESDMIDFWDAFWELSSSRSASGLGLNPISITDFESFCRLHKYDDDEEIQELQHFVRIMDGAYLGAHRKKRDQEIMQQRSESRARRRR